MIKKAVIVNTPTSEIPHKQYLNVEFTDGTFVNLSEEELKYASLLKAINREDDLDSAELEDQKQQILKFSPPGEDDQQLGAFENEGGSTYSEQMQDALEPIDCDVVGGMITHVGGIPVDWTYHTTDDYLELEDE